MSIGVLHGQNGGAGLAVKVVWGTQKPSNAKQGVIWVNTDQKITSWTLQAEEPTEPTEGMVWITIITNSRLNALKKNGIWFTPTSAKQYSDGGWVKKTGEYYNNNQWVALFEATIHITYPAGSTCTATDGTTTLTAPDTSGTWDCVVPNAGDWTVALDRGFSEVVSATENWGSYTVDKWYLFKDGDQHTDLTGGWTAGKNTNSTLYYFDVTDQIRVTTDTYSFTTYGWFVTKNLINLSGFKNLHYHFTRRYSPTANAGFKLGVGSDVLHVGNYKVIIRDNGAIDSYDLTYNVDISSGVTGSVRCDIDEYQNTTTINVDKIYVTP